MNKFVIASFIAVLAVGCSGSDGANGVAALTSVADEPAGANCEFGGVLIRAGNDTNGNGVLDGGEETGGTYLCDGADGSDGVAYLTTTSDEAAGANCTIGGARIDVGADDDGSGTLEESEILATEYVCDGEAGSDGAQGPQGAPGATGADGADALVALADEAVGVNCAAGGVRVDSGTDRNGDGILNPAEVEDTRYACDGADGADGASNSAEVFTSYSTSFINSTGPTVTAGSITFNASGPGRAYVVGSIDAFCSTAQCASGTTTGFVSVQTGLAAASSGAYTYFFLSENRTENVSRSAAFDVTSAGSTTYYLRASGTIGATIGYYRPQLTVIFFAD